MFLKQRQNKNTFQVFRNFLCSLLFVVQDWLEIGALKTETFNQKSKMKSWTNDKRNTKLHYCIYSRAKEKQLSCRFSLESNFLSVFQRFHVFFLFISSFVCSIIGAKWKRNKFFCCIFPGVLLEKNEHFMKGNEIFLYENVLIFFMVFFYSKGTFQIKF